MNSVAIVAIVAMLLAFYCAMQPARNDLGVAPLINGPEVILYIEPPVMIGFPPPLPDRNPRR